MANTPPISPTPFQICLCVGRVETPTQNVFCQPRTNNVPKTAAFLQDHIFFLQEYTDDIIELIVNQYLSPDQVSDDPKKNLKNARNIMLKKLMLIFGQVCAEINLCP